MMNYLFVLGNVDIVNGNLKLILGLIWSLIVRYQIGRSKFPPRKLMLSWLKVNKTTISLLKSRFDRGFGAAREGLILFVIPPGFRLFLSALFPQIFYRLTKSIILITLTFSAVFTATVLAIMGAFHEPMYPSLSTPFLSLFMFYVFYFQAVLPECSVHNFTSDWNSGVYLSALLEYCRPGLYPHWRSLDPDDS